MVIAKPMAFLLPHFSELALRTCGSATIPIFFRSSTLDLRNSPFWIVNTIDIANFFSFAMIAWYFPKSPYVIGNRMTTFSTGVPFQSIPTHTTFVHMNWLSFKNGNLHSTSPSSTSSTIPEKACYVVHLSLRPNNSGFDAYGAKHVGKPHHPKSAEPYIPLLFSRDCRAGLLFTTLVPTPNNASSQNNTYDPMQAVSSNAMPYDAWHLQEPHRSLALQSLDRTISFWKGKKAPKAFSFRGLWLLTPNLSKRIRSFLVSWYHSNRHLSIPFRESDLHQAPYRRGVPIHSQKGCTTVVYIIYTIMYL